MTSKTKFYKTKLAKTVQAAPTILAQRRSFGNFASFLRFYEKNKDDVERLKIIPPTYGQRGFGRIEVDVKPKYRARPSLKSR